MTTISVLNGVFSALALSALAPATAAQGIELSKTGGAVPGPTGFVLRGGTPGALFALVAAPREAPTRLPGGAVLDVPLDWLRLLPVLGFVGHLDAQGRATRSLALPDDPALIGLVLSFQAVSGPPFDRLSNLVRVTPAAPGTFTPTLGAPLLPIGGGAVAALDAARFLFIGGSGPLSQVYDANREEFVLGGASFGVGLLSQATTLADGRVLFTGGLATSAQPTNAAALFDPTSGTTQVLAMQHARAGHGATLLTNGRVLITGGFASFDLADPLALLQGIQNTTELFDPATTSFLTGPNLLEARALHSSTAVGSGNVLIAGGLSLLPIVNIPVVSATAYEYSATLNTFGFPRFMGQARLLHSAVRLGNGKVLVVGGLGLDLTAFLATGDLTQLGVSTHADGELYTPGLFGSFSSAGTLGEGRAGAGIAALAGNRALIAGGFELSFAAGGVPVLGARASAERYDGSTLAPTGAMGAARVLPLLAPLDDGTVLVVGGGPVGAELYQP